MTRPVDGKPAAYVEVLKPGASLLLAFTGVVASVVAASGHPPAGRQLLTAVTILSAAAGASALTNYLDRHIDACMRRTRDRALPSGRIRPAEKVLPLAIGLIALGLGLAWWLQPAYRLVFLADVVGTTAALAWRKRATCVFPQGLLAGAAPVLMGWFAIEPGFDWALLLLCALIGLWLPLHVWSVMVANREDYIAAGLTYFPMSREAGDVVRLLLVFSLALAMAAIGLYFVGGLTVLYLASAAALSAAMVYGAARLVISSSSQNAWRLYKLSAFPYLGLLFLAMLLDVMLR